MTMARHVAANQLGVLEYCQGRGDVGADAVSAERAAMDRLPATSAPTAADESLGRSGSLSLPNGQTMTLAALAAQHGTTVSAFCKQMGQSAAQSAAASTGGGMPSMPGGIQVPTMPSGMTMPSMPSMALPGSGIGTKPTPSQ